MKGCEIRVDTRCATLETKPMRKDRLDRVKNIFFLGLMNVHLTLKCYMTKAETLEKNTQCSTRSFVRLANAGEKSKKTMVDIALTSEDLFNENPLSGPQR